jgi:hypothetical protein
MSEEVSVTATPGSPQEEIHRGNDGYTCLVGIIRKFIEDVGGWAKTNASGMCDSDNERKAEEAPEESVLSTPKSHTGVRVLACSSRD